MMWNFPEIVPRNVYNCGSRDDESNLYVIIFLDTNAVGGGGGGGIPPPRIRNLGAKTKDADALEIEVHTQKPNILLKLLPEF